MNIRSIKRLVLVILTLGITTPALLAETALTDGIRAFICNGEAVVLKETDANWFLTDGNDSFKIQKKGNGWNWEKNGSVYLSEVGRREWLIEILSSDGYSKSDCTDITESVAEVIEVVKPKLNENISTIIADLASVKEQMLLLNMLNASLALKNTELQEQMVRPKKKTLVNDALAEALGQAGVAPSAPRGPPLTAGETGTLRVAVKKCWEVGSLSSTALETTVVVAVSLAQDGKPLTSSIRKIGSEGGTAASVEQAFATARRAIIRCGSSGFKLPSDMYDQWKDLEMTFNPERMRID